MLDAGLRNLFALYMPLAHGWRVLDNSGPGALQLVAAGAGRKTQTIANRPRWRTLKEAQHG